MAAILMLSAALVATTLATLYLASRRRPVAAAYFEAPTVGAPSGMTAWGHRLSVGVYNIHRARGIDGRRDIDRIGRTIGDVDIVGLCEVEGPFYGVRGCQAEQLGRSLGLGWLFAPSQRRWLRFDRGNALLSRGAVECWYREPLVDSTGRRNRILVTAVVRIGGASVPVLVTHLSRHVDQEVQLRAVFDRFLGFDRAILLGDFNVRRDHPVLSEYLRGGEIVDAIGRGLAKDDPERIDWILVRGFRVTGAARCDVGPSDHPYYRVDLLAAESRRPQYAARPVVARHRSAAVASAVLRRGG